MVSVDPVEVPKTMAEAMSKETLVVLPLLLDGRVNADVQAKDAAARNRETGFMIMVSIICDGPRRRRNEEKDGNRTSSTRRSRR